MIVVAALYLAHRRGRLGWAAAAVLAVSGIVGAFFGAAIDTDYRDADGIFDCWPHCTAFHEATRLGFFLAPLFFSVGVVAAVIAYGARNGRSQRTRR